MGRQGSSRTTNPDLRFVGVREGKKERDREGDGKKEISRCYSQEGGRTWRWIFSQTFEHFASCEIERQVGSFSRRRRKISSHSGNQA